MSPILSLRNYSLIINYISKPYALLLSLSLKKKVYNVQNTLLENNAEKTMLHFLHVLSTVC